jgi:hypothetical protein
MGPKMRGKLSKVLEKLSGYEIKENVKKNNNEKGLSPPEIEANALYSN